LKVVLRCPPIRDKPPIMAITMITAISAYSVEVTARLSRQKVPRPQGATAKLRQRFDTSINSLLMAAFGIHEQL
jgi:hypothetical protein